MQKLSVVIITFNEEKNIGRCLQSIQGIADDIVIVDSFSTDKTEEICKKYPVKFVQRKWEGYSSAKNFGSASAKYDWILSLDADEALSDELKNSIQKIKAGNEMRFCTFNRLTNYCGKWIRHCGWYPDKKLRIFDKTKAEWKGIIHEQLKIASHGKILYLHGDCLHYSYYSIEGHRKQTDKFSTISANALFSKGKKINLLKLYVSPIVKFIQSYFFQLGILDGYYGFMICKISAHSTYLKYFKLKQLYKK